MTFSIRIADLRDLSRLKALKSEIALQTYLDLGCTHDQINAWMEVHNSDQSWMEVLAPPNLELDELDCRVYVVESTVGSLVGCGLIQAPLDGTSYMGSLYSRVEGAGVGSMLMRQRLIAATEFGADSVYCNVLASNSRAQRLLSHYGFYPECTYEHPQLEQTVITYVREPHIG